MTLSELHGNSKKWVSQTALKIIFETRGYPSQHGASPGGSFPRFDAPECHRAAIIAHPLVPRGTRRSGSTSAGIENRQSSHAVGNGQERTN